VISEANSPDESSGVQQDISVIVCTYNRCRTLPRALESLASSEMDDSVKWEILIVDNNSTDATREVAEDFANRHPGRFRYLFEGRPGKSYALNAGIREARGGILAFVDDDVTVESTWLRNLTLSLSKGTWAGAGGRTLLAERFTPPRWLALDGPYGMGGIVAAMFDLGDESCDLKTAPFGANMAYRRSVLAKYGMFRTDLGPSPNPDIPRPGEDTELGRRVMAAGERLRYEAGAIVYHPIPTQRIDKSYFLNWWFDYGRAAIRMLGPRPDIAGIPRHYLSMGKAVMTLWIRIAAWIIAFDPQVRFYRKCWIWKTAGEIQEMYRQWPRGRIGAPELI
jgi:glycosyltransferase involved in cell wall biosynthesis